MPKYPKVRLKDQGDRRVLLARAELQVEIVAAVRRHRVADRAEALHIEQLVHDRDPGSRETTLAFGADFGANGCPRARALQAKVLTCLEFANLLVHFPGH